MPLSVVRAALDLEAIFAFYHELPLDNFNQGFWHKMVMGHPNEEPDLARPEMMLTLHCQRDDDQQRFRNAFREGNIAKMDQMMHKGDHLVVGITMPDDRVRFHIVTSIGGVVNGSYTRSFYDCMDATLSFVEKTSPASLGLIAALSTIAHHRRPKIT